MAGDFNGDVKDDIGALYDYESANSSVWVSNGTASGVAGPMEKRRARLGQRVVVSQHALVVGPAGTSVNNSVPQPCPWGHVL